jgi:DNA-3-methyladenine glycosylase
MEPLPASFFADTDVVSISRKLLGCILETRIEGFITSGVIVETEAYAGVTDRASHAWNGRRTARTEVMYGPPGTIYVYLCYGIHEMFNIITGPENTPHAVLIRAIEPMQGLDIMIKRRNASGMNGNLGSGPGVLTQSLGINRSLNGAHLGSGSVSVLAGRTIPDTEIGTSPRIGVGYAGEDALLPYRFFVKNNPFVSGKRIQES